MLTRHDYIKEIIAIQHESHRDPTEIFNKLLVCGPTKDESLLAKWNAFKKEQKVSKELFQNFISQFKPEEITREMRELFIAYFSVYPELKPDDLPFECDISFTWIDGKLSDEVNEMIKTVSDWSRYIKNVINCCRAKMDLVPVIANQEQRNTFFQAAYNYGNGKYAPHRIIPLILFAPFANSDQRAAIIQRVLDLYPLTIFQISKPEDKYMIAMGSTKHEFTDELFNIFKWFSVGQYDALLEKIRLLYLKVANIKNAADEKAADAKNEDTHSNDSIASVRDVLSRLEYSIFDKRKSFVKFFLSLPFPENFPLTPSARK